jgi:hypothetical protein
MKEVIWLGKRPEVENKKFTVKRGPFYVRELLNGSKGIWFEK